MFYRPLRLKISKFTRPEKKNLYRIRQLVVSRDKFYLNQALLCTVKLIYQVRCSFQFLSFVFLKTLIKTLYWYREPFSAAPFKARASAQPR